MSLSSEILGLILHEAGDEDTVEDGLGGGGHHVAGDAGGVLTAHLIVAHNHWFWNRKHNLILTTLGDFNDFFLHATATSDDDDDDDDDDDGDGNNVIHIQFVLLCHPYDRLNDTDQWPVLSSDWSDDCHVV